MTRLEKSGFSSTNSSLASLLREGGWPLALFLILTVLFKILFQFDHHENDPVSRHPVADEQLIIERAVEIAGGRISPEGVFHTAPLYPYLVAPVFVICGPDPLAARLIQALVGCATLLILYLTARLFFTRPWALACSSALLLYYPLTFFEGKLLIATSATFFSTLALFFMTWHGRNPRLWIAAAAGLSVGLAAALRPNLILWAPLLLLGMLPAFWKRRALSRAFLFLAGLIVPVLPFALHNYRADDAFIPFSDNGGINFYLGNNPQSKGSFHTEDPHWGSIKNQFSVAKELAEQELGRSLKSSEVSAYWFRKGFAFIEDRPVDYLLLLVQKAKSFLENFEYAIIYTPGAERSLLTSLKFAFLPYAVLITAAFFGLLNVRQGRSSAPWFPALSLLAAVFLSVLLFFNYSRFRLPALPVLALLGIHGTRQTLALIRGKETIRLLVSAVLSIAVFLLSLIPYGDQAVEQTAHGYSAVGVAFSEEGNLEAAEKYFDKALRERPGTDLILLKRGMVRLESGKYEEAREDLEAALTLNPGAPYHLAHLAIFYARETPYRDLDRALALIQEASGKPMDSPDLQAFVLMTEGHIRMDLKDYRSAANLYEAAFQLAPDKAEALLFAGLAYKQGGDRDRAAAALEQFLSLRPGHAKALMELRSLKK